MPTAPHPALTFLLALFSGWVNRRQQPVIDYLVEENRILRRKFGKRHIRFTDVERIRLARLGKALGRKLLSKIATIVTPDTILRWHHRLVVQKWTYPKKGPGRPPVMSAIRELVLRMARENPWGYKRIQGALANLGHKVARTTIAKILKENGLSPAPERPTSWKTFLKSHWESLAAADFFTVEVWTLRGLRTMYVVFAIRLATRRVEIVGITDSPDADFMKQAARNLIDPDCDVRHHATHLIIDQDTKFTDEFRILLRDEGVKCVRTPHRAPDCNSVCERWVLSVESEVLNRMIFFGVDSLRRAISSFVSHYHTARNHQGLENSIIEPGEEVGRAVGPIHRHDHLGGVLRYYSRAA
ncbi:MAG: integrase core domain-containing protein [Planctomycetota bacterium]